MNLRIYVVLLALTLIIGGYQNCAKFNPEAGDGPSTSNEGGKNTPTPTPGPGTTFEYTAYGNRNTLPVANTLRIKEHNGRIYVGKSKGLFYSDDKGVSFKLIRLANNLVDFALDGAKIYILTSSKRLYYSADSGKTFINLSALAPAATEPALIISLSRVTASGNNIVVGSNYGIYVSTNSGTTFTRRSTLEGLASNSVRDVLLNANVLYVPTLAGLSISINMGTTFINKTTANGLVNNATWRVLPDANNTTIYVSTEGGLSKSVNSAASFTTVPVDLGGVPITLPREIQILGQDMYLSTGDNRLVVSKAGGSFTRIIPTVAITNLHVGSDGTVYVGSSTAPLIISRDGGATFQTLMSDPIAYASVVSALHVGNRVLAVLSGNSLLESIDNGLTFSPNTGLGTVVGVYYKNNKIYVLTNLGINISSDGGMNYIFKAFPTGLVFSQFAFFNNLLFATIAAGGSLYLSMDDGTTFTTVAGLTSIRDVDASDTHIFASGLALYVSSNGGASFTNYRNIPSARISAYEMTAAAANGAAFYTKDGGVTVAASGGNYTLAFASPGKVWAVNGTENHVSTDGTSYVQESFESGISDSPINEVKIIDGHIYLSTVNGLYRK